MFSFQIEKEEVFSFLEPEKTYLHVYKWHMCNVNIERALNNLFK